MGSSGTLLDSHDRAGYAFDLAHMFPGFRDGKAVGQAGLLKSLATTSIESCLMAKRSPVSDSAGRVDPIGIVGGEKTIRVTTGKRNLQISRNRNSSGPDRYRPSPEINRREA